MDTRTLADFVTWMLIESAKSDEDKAIDDIAEPLWQLAKNWLGERTLHDLEQDPQREDWRAFLSDRIEPLLADRAHVTSIERLLLCGGNGNEQRRGQLPADHGTCVLLPADNKNFADRIDEQRELLKAFDPDHRPEGATTATVVITGPPMVGKSQLANHLAHKLKNMSRYPDGYFTIDLDGPLESSDTVTDGLTDLLRAQGVAFNELPETRKLALARYRSWFEGKQVLVVIENAADAEQARLFLPPHAGCAAIVTSSRSLTDLDAACRCDLGPLRNTDAADLLRQLDQSGRSWTAADPTAAEIVDWCGRHPAVITRVGAWMSEPLVADLSLADIASWLREGDPANDVLGNPKLSKSLQLHYQVLAQDEPEAVRVFRLLGVLDVPDVDLDVVMALANRDRSTAEHALNALVDAQLLTRNGLHFSIPPLHRHFAKDRAQKKDGTECRKALGRALRCYLKRDEFWASTQADNALRKIDQRSRERKSLVTVVLRAFSEKFYDLSWQLSVHCAQFFEAHRYLGAWEATARIGLHAAGHLDQEDHRLKALAVTHANLGNAFSTQGLIDEATECYEHSIWCIDELVQLGHHRSETANEYIEGMKALFTAIENGTAIEVTRELDFLVREAHRDSADDD